MPEQAFERVVAREMTVAERAALLTSILESSTEHSIQLPGMDGLTLTKPLKADPATRDAVVLAVTAYAMKGDETRALEAGCDGYLTKPIDTRALADTVARYLAISKPAVSS